MAVLTAKRREMRRDIASAAVSRILLDASGNGIDVTLFGSLARGDFRAHSDVDLLVRGSMDSRRRLLAERIVAEGMRASNIPYDLIFEADLTEDRLRELLNDVI
jgi:predicted nucleotidyltransferase